MKYQRKHHITPVPGELTNDNSNVIKNTIRAYELNRKVQNDCWNNTNTNVKTLEAAHENEPRLAVPSCHGRW